MSNFNYKNIDEILANDLPKRGVTISLEDVALLQRELVVPEFEHDYVDPITGDNPFKLELHTFMTNLSYVKSTYDIRSYSIIPGNTYPSLKLQIHKDLTSIGLVPNEYKVIYNLLRNMIGADSSANNMFISEVSNDRTELKLSLASPDSIVGKQLLARFVLENIKPKTFVPPIVLNFGENKIIDVINVTSTGDPTSFYVKLYEPLPSDLDVYFVCWVAVRLMKSYIDTVLLIEEQIETQQAFISGPNFEVDYDYWITSETNYKSWSDILSENLQTSEQLVNKYISSSGQPVELNIDFTDFKNFIYYSNARDRTENFIYKVELDEFYRSELNRIIGMTGSIETNRVKIQLLKDKLISGFDSFEKYLYYSTTGSFNYTYQVSASVIPYPKYEVSSTSSDYHISTKDGKYKFYGSSSLNAYNWQVDLLNVADDYDASNIYALSRSLPEHVREDSENDQAVSFVNMLGQHFDVIFTYTDHILKKNLREEHPKSGLSQDLIYEATKNMGWTLSHGTSAKDLWEYALGVSGSGEPIWTGKTTIDKYLSKGYEERTKEVWRRILNNLPYIYKTKGSARSIKALLAAYGIPQTLLTIREFGGPDNADLGIVPRADFEKHTYYLNYHSSYPLPSVTQYVSVPWEKVNGQSGWYYPDSLEFRWKMEPSEFYAYTSNPTQTVLQKNSASRVDWYVTVNRTGSDSEKGALNLYIGDGTTYQSASIPNVYLFDGVPLNILLRRSSKNDATSANQTYDILLKTEKYGKIVIEQSASIVVSGSTSPNVQRAWVSDGTLYIGSGSNTQTNQMLSGSIFELRYWSSKLDEDRFTDHTLSARSYNGNSPTSSFYDLQAQFKFWQPFNAATTSSIRSSHPDQSKLLFATSSKMATFVGFNSSSFESTTETYHMAVATVGNNTPFAEKVRIDSSSLVGGLSMNQSSDVSAFDTFSVDSNKVMIAFSPQSIINEDIYESVGNVSIDDYFGEYSNIEADEYSRLKWFAREYWKKYPNKNDFTAYIKLVSIFDFSIFDQIRQSLPARANEILGLVIEPNVLERSKVRLTKGISVVSPVDLVKDLTELSSSIAIPTGLVSSKTTTIRIGFDNDDSEYLELSGEYDVPVYMDADRDTDVVSDIEIQIDAIGNKPHYITTVSASSNIPFAIPVYTPLKTTIIVQDDFVGMEYSVLSGTLKTKASNTLNVDQNCIQDAGLLDTSFNVTYTRHNVYPSLLPTDIGYGTGWATSSNESGKYTAVFLTIYSYPSDSYYSGYKFIYTSSMDLSNRDYSSYSYVTSSFVNPSSLPTSIQNVRFRGCKVTSPDVNVGSRLIPDGKAAVEVYFVSPNQINTDTTFDSNLNGNISVV